MFSLTIPIQHRIRTLSRISQRKEIEGIQIGKQEIKVSLFTDNMTVQKPLKESTSKPLKTKSDFSEVTEYIKIQKSIVFLNISNKSNLQNEILNYKSTKHVEDLYPENY